MLAELCQYLKNWEFNREPDKYDGEVIISEGHITVNGNDLPVQTGQFVRVIGSVFSDGIYRYPDYSMPNEEFTGSVWGMYIPPEIVSLSEEIDAWKEKYEGLDSQAMSPFNSESFAGYSYSKNGAVSGGGLSGWQAVFAHRLSPWRKI